MTAAKLAEQLHFTPIAVSEPDREVTGGYAGDLLSWVMGRAQSGDAWVTIMSNINVAAVAALTDVSLVVLAENVALDAGVAEQFEKRGLNIYSSPLPTFELCAQIRALI